MIYMLSYFDVYNPGVSKKTIQISDLEKTVIFTFFK